MAHLGSGGIGQVFLAYLPDSLTRHLVAAEQASASTSPRGGDGLALQLAPIRERRLSRARGVLIPGVDAVAAPVFDVRGKLMAVMCVVGRSSGMASDWGEPVVQALDQAARNLSRQLGFLETAITTESARDQTKKRIQPGNAT